MRYVEEQWLETLTCGECGLLFAVPRGWLDERRSDKKQFYCPNGHGRAYRVSTEETLRRDLERQKQMLEAEQARSLKTQGERDAIAKAHTKMRERIFNGVCPCCNRSFSDLREHMKTQHADFGADRTLYALRHAFGMTQADVAREAGVDGTHVSLYERGKPVQRRAEEKLAAWVDVHAIKAPQSGSDAAREAGKESA